jgi:hypothetical protein
VNATPDLLPLPRDVPHLLFLFSVPHDYPWEPPTITYLGHSRLSSSLRLSGPCPPPVLSPEEQAFRDRYTIGVETKDGQALRVHMAILEEPDPRKPSCWSRACKIIKNHRSIYV